MRCKACNYPLWQIAARNCPECGTRFAPSEFEFVVNAVRFCCPHCQQAYYGTGPQGQPVPRGFDCVSCSKLIDVDQMVLLPALNVTEQQTAGLNVPWIDRRTQAWFGAFFSTFALGVGNPAGLIDHVPETSSFRRAFIYGSLHLTLHSFLGLGWIVLFPFVMAGAFGLGRGAGALVGLAASVAVALLGPVALLLVWILAAHGVLRVSGPTAAGLSRTAHAVCYSAGNNFLGAIPCVGIYLSPFAYLWWAISGGFMLARAQRVSGWRAGVAMALPAVVALAGIGGLVGWVVWIESRSNPGPWRTANISASANGSGFTTAGSAAYSMAVTLNELDVGGPLDAHASRLLLDGDLDPEDLLLPGSLSTTDNCSINGIPLGMFRFDAGHLEPIVKALDSPGQHRVGDFVFVAKGIDPKTADERLWLAIGWPDPALNLAQPQEVELVKTQGAAELIRHDDFQKRLEEQNVLRTELGLPPVRHPALGP